VMFRLPTAVFFSLFFMNFCRIINFQKHASGPTLAKTSNFTNLRLQLMEVCWCIIYSFFGQQIMLLRSKQLCSHSDRCLRSVRLHCLLITNSLCFNLWLIFYNNERNGHKLLFLILGLNFGKM
jgi:hypothetical protein